MERSFNASDNKNLMSLMLIQFFVYQDFIVSILYPQAVLKLLIKIKNIMTIY